MIKRDEVFKQFDGMDRGLISEMSKWICPIEQSCTSCVLRVNGQSGKIKESFCLPHLAHEYLRSKEGTI